MAPLLTPTVGSAQPTDREPARRVVGTLLLAHGGEPSWNAEVERIAREARTGGLLELAYLMGPAAATHRFQDRVARLIAAGATDVVIVPLLVSSHSGHYEQIRYLAGLTDTLDAMMHHHLHMAGLERPTVSARLHVTRALDDAPEVAIVLAEQVHGRTGVRDVRTEIVRDDAPAAVRAGGGCGASANASRCSSSSRASP